MTVDRLLLLRDGRMEMLGARDEVMARVLPPTPQGNPQIKPQAVKEVRS
jgi:ABC-type protease/lipase transport system fused ATPase/permease subunit